MEIVLSRFGTTFATRERARELVAQALGENALGEPVVDLNGISASPSFMAELLQQLALKFVSVGLVGGSDYLRTLTESLIGRLGLRGRVTLRNSSIA